MLRHQGVMAVRDLPDGRIGRAIAETIQYGVWADCMAWGILVPDGCPAAKAVLNDRKRKNV